MTRKDEKSREGTGEYTEPSDLRKSDSGQFLGYRYRVSGNTYKKPRPPSERLKVSNDQRACGGYSFGSIYDLMVGIPPRVRRYVKHVWKRSEKRKQPWERIADELAPEAAKILKHRLDVVTYTGATVAAESIDVPDVRLQRMTRAKLECDALLIIYAHYFTIGLSSRLYYDYLTFAGLDNAQFFVGGIAAIVDYGQMTSSERRSIQAAAMKTMEHHCWKLPVRHV